MSARTCVWLNGVAANVLALLCADVGVVNMAEATKARINVGRCEITKAPEVSVEATIAKPAIASVANCEIPSGLLILRRPGAHLAAEIGRRLGGQPRVNTIEGRSGVEAGVQRDREHVSVALRPDQLCLHRLDPDAIHELVEVLPEPVVQRP